MDRRAALQSLAASAVATSLPAWSFMRPRLGAFGSSGPAPLVLYLSATAVPTGQAPSATYIPSGMTAANYQGESGQGGFLSIYGINLGTTAGLGTTTRVYLGGAEVAAYFTISNAITTANNSAFSTQRLDVQVGSAAVQALTLGVPVQVTVVVNGVSSNNNDLFGNQLTYTPIQAPIIYVDETSGNDANAGTFSSPVQHAQTYTGSVFAGPLTRNTTVSGGKSNGVQAGTHIVYRGGTYTYTTTFAQTSIAIWQVTGCDPTLTPTGGLQGVNAGPLTFTARPTIAGPEVVTFAMPSSALGYVQGQDTARANANPGNPYYSTGANAIGGAKYVEFANLSVIMNTSGTNTGQSPFYGDYSCDFWRVVNCEMSTPTTVSIDIRGGGFQGDSHGARILGCYVHDIHCNSTFENHGIYMDGGTEWTSDGIFAFNYIKNAVGGSGIQFYNSQFSGTDKWGYTGHANNIVAYNWIDTVQKYGINHADGSVSAKTYCNVVLNCTSYSMRFNVLGNTGCAFDNVNNTFYNGCSAGTGGNAMIADEGNIAGGRNRFDSNIFVLGSSRSSTTTAWVAVDGAPSPTSVYSWTDNQLYDPLGHNTGTTLYGATSGSVNGNPVFSASFTDFSLGAGSPCIGTGDTDSNIGTILYDFAMQPMPRAGQTSPSRGAYA